MIYLLFGFVVVVVVVVVVDCSFSKLCTISRRFSNPCFMLVRIAIIGSPFPFGVAVVGDDVAVVISQINATNNKKVFILMGAKTVN